MVPKIHEKPEQSFSYERLCMLWERYPAYRELATFSTLEALLEEHESYRKDFDEALCSEYVSRGYERFLIQLSWSDLAYRHHTMELLQRKAASGTEGEGGEAFGENSFVERFLAQFREFSTDQKACFLFPESYSSRYFVIQEVCKGAEVFRPVRNLFPDEERLHYLAVFDKQDMDSVLLMFHLLYSQGDEDLPGGYSLYDYSLPWYQHHLWEEGIPLRSPFLPDLTAKYQGNLPYYHNPAKTVYVRRNVEHILKCGYFSSELEFFYHLTRSILPFFHWWYQDLAWYEEKDGLSTDWKLQRTRIRTQLTAEGVIKPKWKHELSLFKAIRKRFPDTLYQYRPEWLGRQSLDLYIPSLRTGIEYQGIQHYHPVEFFGGEEALKERQELDRVKRQLCEENGVRLIEWPYSLEPSQVNVKKQLG